MDINEFNKQFKDLYAEEKKYTKDIIKSTEKNDRVDITTIMNGRLRDIGINPGWLSLPIMKKSSDSKSPQWFSLTSLHLNDKNNIVSVSLKDLESGEKIVVPLEDFQKLIDYNEKQLENNADLYYSVGDQYGLRRGTKRETNVEVITENKIEELLKSYQDKYVNDRIKKITEREAIRKFQRTNKPISKRQLLYIYIRIVNMLKPTDDFVEYFKSHKTNSVMRDAIKYMFRITHGEVVGHRNSNGTVVNANGKRIGSAPSEIAYDLNGNIIGHVTENGDVVEGNPDAQLVIKHHGNNLEFQYHDNKKAIRNFEKAPTSENL